MKKFFLTLLVSASCMVTSQAWANNLLQVYKQALLHDPAFKAAKAQWLSDQQNIPISRSALLPSFDFKGQLERQETKQEYATPPAISYGNWNQQYQVTLSQSLFNLQGWSGLRQAKAVTRASAAVFSAAAQDLIARTVGAYFGVLEAQDILRYTRANKKAVKRQLARTRQRFKVGLVAITDVYQAQANYDGLVAQEITARNDLANRKELLREITGRYYKNVAKIYGAMPLFSPDPKDINSWVKAALKQNYSLLAAKDNLKAAYENIHTQALARFPSVTGIATGSINHNSNTGHSQFGLKETKQATLGVGVDMPLLQGGLVTAKTRQARFDYQKASATLEQTKRQVVSKTRQDYLAVIANISKIKADRQAVKSATSSLKATEAAYLVGTQTMVDVLKEQTTLYNAQSQLARDQYDLLLKTIALKQDTGTLGIKDVVAITKWLQRDFVKSKTYRVRRHPSRSFIVRQVRKMNSRHYTLQLMASRSKNSIIRFVNRHRITGKTYCISARYGWYKLIKGNYPTISSAKRASRRAARRYNVSPWIRKVLQVQREL